MSVGGACVVFHRIMISLAFPLPCILLLGCVALLRQLLPEAVVTMIVRMVKREVCCVGWSSGGSGDATPLYPANVFKGTCSYFSFFLLFLVRLN